MRSLIHVAVVASVAVLLAGCPAGSGGERNAFLTLAEDIIGIGPGFGEEEQFGPAGAEAGGTFRQSRVRAGEVYLIYGDGD